MADVARLVDTPGDPVPPDAEPGWVMAADGLRLRAALFPATTPRPRGTVVLSGGRTEPIEKYFETIADFRARGFAVLAHDWRGQGLSGRELDDPLKGHANGWKPFIDDYGRLLDAYAARLPKPWIAVGHSMGGCLTLLALAEGEARFAGAVLCAPMLGLQTGKFPPFAARAITAFNLLIGRADRYLLGQPGAPFDDAFDGNPLTHDRARFDRYRAQVRAEPGLALGSPTYGWLDFAWAAVDRLADPARLGRVTIPVSIVSAEKDALVDNAAQAHVARHLPNGRIETVSGAFHEILMETDEMRNIFLRIFDALMGKTAPAPEAPPVAAPVAAPPEPITPVEPVATAAPAAPGQKAAAKRAVVKAKTAKATTAKPKPAPGSKATKPATAKTKLAPQASPKPSAKAGMSAAQNALAPKAPAKPKSPSTAAAKPKATVKRAARPKAAKPKT